MTDGEAVDPQYRWILPEHIELKAEVANYAAPSEAFLVESMEARCGYLRLLAGIGNRFAVWLYVENEESDGIALLHAKWEAFKASNPGPSITWYGFMHRLECLQSLQRIGLDIRGGILSLHKILKDTTAVPNKALPMSHVLVVDAEKARKYLNMGVHIGTDFLEHPSTLEEAANAFATVSRLVQGVMAAADIEKKIATSTNESEIWKLKREKFRVQTKERYHERLLDLALEEKLSELRGNKWARLNGA